MNQLMEWFEYEHLPIDLQPMSKKFHDLAAELDKMLPETAEKKAGLRKLLESKDCAVWAWKKALEVASGEQKG